MRLRGYNLLWTLTLLTCLALELPSWAQTLRFAGGVRAGEAYRHPIGRGLALTVTTDGMRVGRGSKIGESDNFARCVTPPVHGPNALDFQAADFDSRRGNEALGFRRSFHFVLNAADDEAECQELGRASDPGWNGNEWYSHEMGRATVTLSRVKLTGSPSDSESEIRSFHFKVVVQVSGKRYAWR